MVRRVHRSYLSALVFASLVSWALCVRVEPTPASELEAIPSRVILTCSGEPATTQVVTWRTEALLSLPQAQITKFTADPDFVRDALTFKGTATIDDLGSGKKGWPLCCQFYRPAPGHKVLLSGG